MQQKTVIIGYSGSGKSTLAQELGRRYQCEVLYMDRVHWLPGWKERDDEEKKKIVSEFMDRHDCWVIDGNYKSLDCERRMSEAIQIIFLNFPVLICLYRAVKRWTKYRGKSRESMTEGCNEKIDIEFLWWILHEGRDKSHRAWYQKICEDYGDKVIVLKRPKEVRRLLRS